MWSLLASAALLVARAYAQLAQADNGTLPTSQFWTRPQAYAPAINITTSGAFSHGYIFLAPYQHPGTGAYIYDKFGNLVWDGFGMPGANVQDFKVCNYQGSPHLCLTQANQQNGYAVGQGMILDSNYQVVKTVQTGRDAMPADQHEFVVIDGDRPSAIQTSYRTIPYDLSAFGVTSGQGWLEEGMFQEIDIASGEVIFEWYSTNHVNPSASQVKPNTTDISGDGLTPHTGWDYFHINAIDKSASGNYLISARHTSTLYYINGTDTNVIWQLSFQGDSDFTCTNFNFSYQHDVRIQREDENGMDITIFDNANNCYNSTAKRSSGRFITIDYASKNATQTRRVLPPQSISSCSQGNTQVLDKGYVFQGWGDKSWFSEHDGDNNMVLAGTFTNNPAYDTTAMNYRAFSFEWQSTPNTTKPSVYSYAKDEDTGNNIYVSWNGATTVTTWRYYAADKIGDAFTVIGNTTHAGFETRWTAPSFARWVMVEAVGWDGTSLGNSSYQPTFVPSQAISQYCDDFSCQAAMGYSS